MNTDRWGNLPPEVMDQMAARPGGVAAAMRRAFDLAAADSKVERAGYTGNMVVAHIPAAAHKAAADIEVADIVAAHHKVLRMAAGALSFRSLAAHRSRIAVVAEQAGAELDIHRSQHHNQILQPNRDPVHRRHLSTRRH